jgi:hypothetical protein
MAGTLKSNLENLQTAFLRFADGNLTEPLAKLTGCLNRLAEDPKRVEAVFNSIKRGLLIIGGIKISAGVLSFLSTLKNFKGGNAKITEQLSLAGSAGAAMPVFVTNWSGGGGVSGGSPLPGQLPGAGGLLDQYGNPIGSTPPQTPPATPGEAPKGKGKWNLNKPNWKAAGTAAGVAGANRCGFLLFAWGMKEIPEYVFHELPELLIWDRRTANITKGPGGASLGRVVM